MIVHDAMPAPGAAPTPQCEFASPAASDAQTVPCASQPEGA
jgi:hypothetical protein